MTEKLRHIGLKQVAQEANCAISVASTVLNGARGNTVVSEATRRRVQEIARRLGYRPNFAARSLVSRRTRTLGVYIMSSTPSTGPGNAYEGQILNGLEAVCDKHHYDLLLINLGGHKSPQQCIHQMVERRIDGLALIRVDGSPTWLQELHQLGARLVLVDSVDPDPSTPALAFDNVAAMRLAVEHLAGLGHRRIGFLGSCLSSREVSAAARQEAFGHVIREKGLEWNPTWAHDASMIGSLPFDSSAYHCQQEGCLGVRHFLSLAGPRPTAMVAYNDLVAWAACKELHQRGVQVPRDMSVVGVGNVPVSEYSDPTLTTLSQPMYEMGYRAAELLIDGPAAAPPTRPGHRATGVGRHELFAPRLVVRQSTAPPPEAAASLSAEARPSLGETQK